MPEAFSVSSYGTPEAESDPVGYSLDFGVSNSCYSLTLWAVLCMVALYIIAGEV